MRAISVLAAFLVVSACAQGVPAGDGDGDAPGDEPGDDRDQADAAAPTTPDAAVADATPDAAAQPVTLSQTGDQTITKQAIGCRAIAGISANSYYRVFRLADHEIQGRFDVTRVDFAVWKAQAGGGGRQPAKVRLHTLSGTTPTADALTLLASKDIEIRDGDATLVEVAITAEAPAGASLVAEIAIPDGRWNGHHFAFGGNASGERQPAFWSSACDDGVARIADMDGPVDIVLTVTGWPR